MRKLLLVDDEQRMLDLIALYLKPHGYVCVKAKSGEEAIELIEKQTIDLVLLDVMMPDMDGWTVCKNVRAFSNVPIIMLTAREQEADVVKGLRLGADDYVTKPFSEQELLARIEALLRRISPGQEVEINGLSLNEEQFTVFYQEKPVRLTRKEFALLSLLMKNPGKVFERNHLLELVWGYDTNREGRTIDSHVRNIREKIREAGFPAEQHFQTVWGVGYKWINEKLQ